MRYFATYFDSNYVDRALALACSLKRHEPASHLFMLCLDDESFSEISSMRNEGITPVSLWDLEVFDPPLAETKSGRSIVEYYWTCGPAFLLYVLSKYAQVDLLTYLDSDMFFFSSPQPLHDELRDHSVGV